VSDASGNKPAGNESDHRGTGIIRLLLSGVVIAIVWCVVLPQMAGLPQVREYMNWLDERGIDPTAMYYTELPAMDPILDRLERPRPSK
jgi:hypothetical protein